LLGEQGGVGRPGACFAIGYGLGVFLQWLWRYLELPEPQARMRQAAISLVAVFCLSVAILFLWWSEEWQNSVRAVMGMEPVASANPLKVCLVALATFAMLLAVARLFKGITFLVVVYIRRYVPKRVANVVSVALAALLFWSFASNVLVPAAFRAVDWSYREYDALLEPERAQPTDPGKTGSAASLVKWDELGRADVARCGVLGGRRPRQSRWDGKYGFVGGRKCCCRYQ
jgi:uncharacterized membrane protein